ncbi:RagB/SusD family nutrient uptake outer membrane protein [Pseudobacter ginsenosidimutans]|uniref:SusD-like starch-binding protein associating with outer membrane n=1 Tax=Pseudobacter ginsenosidimutans TaxID=661488 RepID=A0A4Q7N5S7_9BACT|nr:RagB/SusD family nutrient uptake outer membrane protein [Pseudobacter ginsenosidimutans]QEC44923.1 RagB/SusD family nutrient uptake outer membrane protein [Pseudobacter ginsenosidimutans]RZS76414.1 SusD-like starch-binding protein associating with outer membrane [Pseudobacter ginsenosidimutans]
MKKITLLLVIISSLTGCKKWLDVQPSDQIVDKELFSQAQGFRHSLNGVYIQAAGKELFGKNLSWGLNTAYSQEYDGAHMSNDRFLAYNFDKTNPFSQDIINEIWTKAYNNIANCNKLLKEIEALSESSFAQGRSERNLIIGEAMAMRALMHFELLRLYAPAPAKDPNGKFIPYVNTYPAKLNPPVATSQVIDNITADLEKAQSLVAENDTIVNRSGLANGLQNKLSSVGFTQANAFFAFRMHRLNYLAIHGLLARVYLYAGNYAKAKQSAKYVYENFGPHGRLKFSEFTSELNATTTSGNRYSKLADDILFAAYDADLIANLSANYQNSYRLSTDVDQWFPATDRDFRAGFISEFQTDNQNQKGKVSDKWLESRAINYDVKAQNTIVPVLRLSEVYYIYSETLFKDGETNEALNVLNQVRNARGKLTTFSQSDETAFYQELLAEYRREFINEGQTFFAYKRLQRNLMRGSQVIVLDDRFILPIPQQEQIF